MTDSIHSDPAAVGPHRTALRFLPWLGWLLLAALVIVTDPFNLLPSGTAPGSKADAHGGHTESMKTEQLWTCPMHPEVLQDHPGQCPICKMDLVPVEVEASDHAHDATHGDQLWTCGMHPQVIQEEPGQCPICGMDLVPMDHDSDAASESEAQAANQSELWTCPMHPEVIQDHPGQCPICKMDLVPLETDGAGPGPAGDKAGRATVRIDAAVVQNMNVVTEPVARRDVSRQVRTVGYLDYDQEKMVSVTTKYPGFIEKVHVNYLGQPVEKGEPLFEVYSPELVQTQQELLSAVEYVKQLSDASEDVRRRAQGLLEAARARLGFWDISRSQIADLERTGKVFRTLSVVAPASGVIMKRMDGLEGMAVRPGMELLHIAGLSSLWLRVEVYEDQLSWVDIGSRAVVSLSYFPGESFTGTVRYVEPSVSEKTRTLGLTLEVPNRGGRLRPGMYATVLFDPVAAKDAITVPSSAVIRTGERNLVVVAIGNGRFTPREVTLGPAGEGFVTVLSGLEEGERVVTSAQFLIDSESNLREAVQKMLAARKDVSTNRPAAGGGHVH